MYAPLMSQAQALIIMSDLRAIYSAHLRKYSLDAGSISFSGFKTLKPWYAIKGDRETCLCKWCENFKCYQEALKVTTLCPSPAPLSSTPSPLSI